MLRQFEFAGADPPFVLRYRSTNILDTGVRPLRYLRTGFDTSGRTVGRYRQNKIDTALAGLGLPALRLLGRGEAQIARGIHDILDPSIAEDDIRKLIEPEVALYARGGPLN